MAVPEDALTEMPRNMDYLQASLIGTPWTTAYLTLSRTQARKGETVVVIGAGGNVGSAISELAGSSLFGCDVLRAGRGSKYDVDITSSSGLGLVRTKTDGKGADVVIDATGVLELSKAGMSVLGKKGRLGIISVGASHGKTEIDIDLKALYRSEHSVVGCNSFEHSLSETAAWMTEFAKGFESGALTPPKSDGSRITRIGLDGVADAYKQLDDGSRQLFVIEMDEDSA